MELNEERNRDDVSDDNAPCELPDDQAREIDRRIALYRANPNDVVSWDEVKATIDQGTFKLADWQKEELDKRMETYDSALERGVTWEEFLEKLRSEQKKG